MNKEDKTIIIKTKTPLVIKEEADMIFNDLGLDMSTAINMFLRETVLKKELPFDVHEHPSKDLLAAIAESEQIFEEIKSGKRKGYHNVQKMFEDILNEPD